MKSRLNITNLNSLKISKNISITKVIEKNNNRNMRFHRLLFKVGIWQRQLPYSDQSIYLIHPWGSTPKKMLTTLGGVVKAGLNLLEATDILWTS